MSKLFNKNDIVFLYVTFVDKNGNPILNINDPRVRILHEKNEQIYEDLPWTQMQQLSSTEYYYNYTIPYNADCGLYDVVYCGDVDDKMASMVESFHVINKSEIYTDSIKLYGYITDSLNNLPLSSVSVEIISMDGIYVTQSYTKDNGYWEAYMYPGEYSCTFKKDGFNTIQTNIQIGDENNEIQFNNISLESKELKLCGNGIYKVTDSYLLKNGIPLDGLIVEAFDILNPKEVVAKSVTNNRGVWTIYLDPGFYFLKVTGKSMDQDFDKTFRLKIEDDGKYNLDDMNDNKATIMDNYISSGNGSETYSDIITDKFGNPITDVQVTAYQSGEIIAQTYTTSTGRYELFLDKGEYIIDIYHPSFKEICEFKITI